MNFRKGKRRDQPEVNLIAFIDVLLVILIFLMVSTTFTRVSTLRISLPSAEANPAANLPVVVRIGVDAQGHYAVGDRRTDARDAQSLALVLKQASQGHRDAQVEVHADAMASHQSVINVMEAARLAGMAKLTFATQADPAQAAR